MGYILGIGACNIDIYGKSSISIRTHFDHPAKITSSIGGVTHNVIANFSKLGGKTKLITVLGDDAFGDAIYKECKKNNIDISHSLITKDESSNVFMQVQDKNNDMYLALCDMSSLKYINKDYINKKANVILNSSLLVLDPSLPHETIKELIKICKNKVPIYMDPMSNVYAKKIKRYIKDLTCIKPNKSELEVISGIKIKSNNDLEKACKILLNKGLKKIFVSLGKNGLLYMDKNTKILNKLKPANKIVNASGAGDALMAAIVYGATNDLSDESTINLALAAGLLATQSIETINPQMSMNSLKKILKENGIKL